jgi:hypothetical protein
MLHRFHCPLQVRFEPVFAFPAAIVASVQPDVMQARKLLWDSIDEQDHAITVGDICLMDLGFEDEALGIDRAVDACVL